jgi:LysM repeat protein
MPSLPKTRISALLAFAAIGSLAWSSPTNAAPAGRRTCAEPASAAYTVRDGDSWFDIAQSTQVRTNALLQANGASVTTAIHPGDVLCLPAGAVAPAVAPGDACASAGLGTYTVASGDSWSGIAQAVDATMANVLAANGATVATTLQPGELLCLPAGAKVAATKSRAVSTPMAALPLQGPCWFGDTWRDARANGRTHEGVDLIAQAGKYVYAVADGTLTRRAWDQPGRIAGNAWWLTASDGTGTYFWYGHMYDFAQGLQVGSKVKAGQIIGFVGETGSAATAHLHFEIHPGGGDPVNPYPTMKALGGCDTGQPYRQPGGWVPDTGGVTID